MSGSADPNLSTVNLEWRARAREVAEKYVRPVAWKYDRLQEYPWEIQKRLKEYGLFKVFVPKEYGGSETSGVLNLCIVVEELARACGGIGVGFAVNALGSFPLMIGGTDEQKQRLLPSVAAGDRLVAFGLSERNAGSDAGGMVTRGEKNDSGWVVNGHKKWNTNGAVATLNTIFAVTDPESKSRRISAFLVEYPRDGFHIVKVEDKMGIRAIPVVELEFRNMQLPDDALLGGRPGMGFSHAMATLDKARPGVAAQAVGCAQGALDFALHYATKRVQFGEPIVSKQMVQAMLADMAAQVEAARQLVHAAARHIDAGSPKGNKFAAMAKCFATDTAMRVTTEAVQILGGYGFMRDYPVEKYMRDAKITQIYEGTNQVQRMVIARNLIKEAAELDSLAAYFPIPESAR
ncbi:MAG: putative acyl-CoA dehydrogenase fadE25 [Planctomycetes bacterium]|nr:putative acyl-CoA dehydrogenase fadE25 [Planctomycetota bacterium]